MSKVHFKILKSKRGDGYVLEVIPKGDIFAELISAVNALENPAEVWSAIFKAEPPHPLVSDQRLHEYVRCMLFLYGTFKSDTSIFFAKEQIDSSELQFRFILPAAMVENKTFLSTKRTFIVELNVLKGFVMHLKKVQDENKEPIHKPLTLKSIAKTIGSAFLGFLMGIPASFIPGWWYLFHDLKSGVGGVGAIIFYLISLPFFMLWHMGKGLIHGAKNGFIAALIYPKTLNEDFRREDRFTKLTHQVRDYIDIDSKLQSSRGFFTQQEELRLEQLLASEHIPSERRSKLKADFHAYKNYMSTTTCIFTGRSLRELKHPICLQVGEQTYACEAEELQPYIAYFKARNQPIVIECFNKSLGVLIQNPQISQWGMGSFSRDLQQFITKARTLLSSAATMCESLGVTNETLMRTVALPGASTNQDPTPLAHTTDTKVAATDIQGNMLKGETIAGEPDHTQAEIFTWGMSP